jgi:single-strand DNA-binding protein
MLNQLIVTSVAAGARRPGSARRIALAKPPQFHIKNKITLKGYIGKDAENFATKQQKTVTVLSLATKSGYKDKQKDEWVNHTEWHRIVAFGKPAEYAKNLKKGDYIEIEGELRSTEFDAEVGEGKKKTTVKRRGWEVRVSIVKKLAQPASGGNPDAEPITEDDAA